MHGLLSDAGRKAFLHPNRNGNWFFSVSSRNSNCIKCAAAVRPCFWYCVFSLLFFFFFFYHWSARQANQAKSPGRHISDLFNLSFCGQCIRKRNIMWTKTTTKKKKRGSFPFRPSIWVLRKRVCLSDLWLLLLICFFIYLAAANNYSFLIKEQKVH